MASVARSALMGGVAFAAFFVSPAMAQGIQNEANLAVDSQPPADESASPVRNGISGADIIVTAQRREERAQDVPVVVTAFTPERLEQLNISEPQDLYGAVPSLVAGTQGSATSDSQSYSIRGQSTGFLSSPAVAVYMAEVPVPASISLPLQGGPGMFVDLENVQVLSGPQGTLFGRNTTGGAVLFTPHKPTNKFEGYVQASVGNYNLISLEGAINVPIVSEKLMVRAVAAYEDRRGYTKDIVWNKWRDDKHWYSGRIGIMMKPTERFENYLLAYGTKSSNNGAGFIHRGWNENLLQAVGFCGNPPIPFLGVSCDVYQAQTDQANAIGPRRTRMSTDAFSKIETWGVINTTSLELSDELMLRNIISFQKLRSDYGTDQDGTPLQQYDPSVQNADLPNFPIPGLSELGLPITPGNVYVNGNDNWDLPRDSLEQFTEELQIQGTMLDDRLNFTVGGFYYDSKPDRLWGATSLNFCPALFTGLCAPAEAYTGVSNKSKALYAQSTLDLGVLTSAASGVRLTTGFRYTWDTVSGFNYSFRHDATAPGNVICNVNGATPIPLADVANDFDPNFAPGLTPAPGSGCKFDATLKSKAPTYTLGLDYRPTSDLMLYAKVSRGYKAGGINTFAVRTETRVFQPEKLMSYEAGFKSDWRLGGTIPFRLNATYYFSKYNNIQRPAGDFNTVTSAQGAQVLGASAHVQGLEVETSIRPFDLLELAATVSHTDADYKKFEQLVLTPAGQFACNGGDFPNGLVPAGEVADYSCNRFQFLTPWIVNLRGTLDIPVPEDMGKMSLFVSYSYLSSQNTSPLNPPEFNGVPVEPGVTFKAYSLLNASINWRNVGGTGFDATLFGTNLTNKLVPVGNSGVFQTLGVWSTNYGEPRMYGLKLRYRFGS